MRWRLEAEARGAAAAAAAAAVAAAARAPCVTAAVWMITGFLFAIVIEALNC